MNPLLTTDDFQGIILLTYAETDGAAQQLALAERLAARQHHVIDLAESPTTDWQSWIEERVSEDDTFDVVHLVNIGHALVLAQLEGESCTWLAEWEANPAALESVGQLVLLWADAFAATEIREKAPALYARFAAHEELSADEKPLTQQALQLLASLPTLSGDAQAQQHIALGKILAQLHLYAAAMHQFDKVLEGEIQTENPATLADAYFQAGALHGNLGETDDAWTCFNNAIDHYSAADSADDSIAAGLARTHTGLAQLFANADNAVQAIQQHRLAIPFFVQTADALGLGYAHKSIAAYTVHKGNQQEAKAEYLAAATHFADIRPAETADCYAKIGFIHKWRNEPQEALAAFEQALPFAETAADSLQIDSIRDSIEEMTEAVQKFSAKPAEKKGFWSKLLG